MQMGLTVTWLSPVVHDLFNRMLHFGFLYWPLTSLDVFAKWVSYKTQHNLPSPNWYSAHMPTNSDKPHALTLFHLYVLNLVLSYLMEHLFKIDSGRSIVVALHRFCMHDIFAQLGPIIHFPEHILHRTVYIQRESQEETNNLEVEWTVINLDISWFTGTFTN